MNEITRRNCLQGALAGAGIASAARSSIWARGGASSRNRRMKVSSAWEVPSAWTPVVNDEPLW